MSDDRSELLKQSLQLQEEINNIFHELSSLNRQVRIDIDDFCNIYENSIMNVNESAINRATHNGGKTDTRRSPK